MIELILAVSIVLNIIAFFYCRFLVRNLNNLVESIKDMSIIFVGFREHVEMLHETEMFYGDSSLQSLIEHSKFVLDAIEDNSEIMNMFELENKEENDTEKKEEE